MKLAEIEGISDVQVAKLARAGIKTLMALFKRGSTPELRKKLSKETGISERLLLEWVHFADLLRVEGIGVEYAGLLDEIGIDSVEALAVQNAKSLAKELKKSNEAKKRVNRLPSIKHLARAIKSASKVSHAHSLTGDATTPAPAPRKKQKEQSRKLDRRIDV